MNAFVIYEQEADETVAIHRVCVGEGKVKTLLKEFYKEISEKCGPQPELRYTERVVNDVAKFNETGQVVTISSGTFQEVDPESEQVLYNWRATVHAAKNPHRFGDWLVEKHGWVECDDVHQEAY